MHQEKPRRAALLWDESFLWGIMARKALMANGLAFDLIRSEDVRTGKLGNYRLLFVPGGWASNKIKSLGEAGVDEIKRFVRDGGAYLGFCGGAGLATMDGIGLLPVKRRPTRDRVPSFSGPILVNAGDHPIWEGMVGQSDGSRPSPAFSAATEAPQNARFALHAWWPSQFLIDGNVSVLATYGRALPDAFSADINVGDAEANGGWSGPERLYQINLDPKRLLDEPAVIEGTFGKGRVLLSLVHFDTPGDGNGAIGLKNLWKNLGGEYGAGDAGSVMHEKAGRRSDFGESIARIEHAVSGLIDLGVRNFLWFWRNSLLLQWRRGVRGLEYCTLYVMVRELSELSGKQGGEKTPEAERILRLVREFVEKAKHLLVRERYALQQSLITYERCDDREIQSLREELFSRSKSHGGLFKQMIDGLDHLLFGALVRR